MPPPVGNGTSPVLRFETASLARSSRWLDDWSNAAGVLYAAVKLPASGAMLYAEFPYASAAGTTTWNGFVLSDRLRIEDVMGIKGNPWRYRKQVQILRTLQAMTGAPYAFVGDEVFVEVVANRFARNRLLAGGRLPISKRATTESSYVNQDNAKRVPGRIQGLFFTLILNF